MAWTKPGQGRGEVTSMMDATEMHGLSRCKRNRGDDTTDNAAMAADREKEKKNATPEAGG